MTRMATDKTGGSVCQCLRLTVARCVSRVVDPPFLKVEMHVA